MCLQVPSLVGIWEREGDRQLRLPCCCKFSGRFSSFSTLTADSDLLVVLPACVRLAFFSKFQLVTTAAARIHPCPSHRSLRSPAVLDRPAG